MVLVEMRGRQTLDDGERPVADVVAPTLRRHF